MPPSPVVYRLSDPHLYCRSCAFRFHTHIYSSVYDWWPHQYYYFRGMFSLHHSWYYRWSCIGLLLAYPVRVRLLFSWSLWIARIYRCRSRQGTAPDPSYSWRTCPRFSVQDRRCIPLSHCTGPWSFHRIIFMYLGFWSASSYLWTSWNWIPVPWFFQLSQSTHYLQSFRMV